MYSVQIMNAKNREESLTLEILQTIDNDSNLTQRHLAARLGVALGLANSYLKRCVRKGLIKIEQAPANRYLYYLTPRGFTEKSRLTAEYLSSSFDFYRRASASCNNILNTCADEEINSVLLCGISELAEIAMLRARERKITVSGFMDNNHGDDNYLGYPVWKHIQDADDFDACIITDLDSPFEVLTVLKGHVDTKRIFIPDILGIKPPQELV